MRTNQTEETIVTFDKKPESFAKVTKALGDEKINILGYDFQPRGNEATLRLVTDDPTKAQSVLSKAGIDVSNRDLVTVNLPNEPGQLSQAVQRLAESGVDIEASFPTMPTSGDQFELAFCCDDVPSAIKALNR